MLVVVGNSSDSTLATAQEIKSKDARVQVIEQNGLGIYTAMNQGIEQARTDLIWFMNAGDEFADVTALNVGIQAMFNANVGLVIGGYKIADEGNHRVFSFASKPVSTLDFAFTRRGGCHQAMIFRTEILRELGGFTSNFRLANDFELVLKVIERTGAIRVPDIFAKVEPGGVSDQGILLVHREKNQIRKLFFQNFGINLASLTWTLMASSKVVLRQTLKRLKNFK
jgi:glycosyltransferase involved in cell wall biosynthesis